MNSRRGFTLVELLIVLAVIATLFGMTLPVMKALQRRNAIAASTALVQAVAGRIATDPRRSVTCADGRDRAIWDIDGDGLIDGDPAAPGAAVNLVARAPVGYRGVLAMLAIEVPVGAADAQRRPVDRWGQPLRIAYASGAYGGTGCGIWSTGPNRVCYLPTKTTATADELVDDDLCSWRWRKER